LPTASAQNLQKTQTEILQAMRGKLSSSALSVKLGYRFNQVARWEKGERRLLWTDFVALCEARRLPLAEQMRHHLGYEGDLHASGPFTKTLLGGKSIDEAAKATKLSRSKISRWLNGKATPTFLETYQLLRLAINPFGFFERLVDLSQVPSLAKDYRLFQRQRELAHALPYLDAIMEALLVRSYREAGKHNAEALASAAGLSVEGLHSALASLEEAGMVEKKAGKYQAREIGIDYSADKEQMTKMILHWLREATRAIENLPARPLKGSLAAFSVFSLSKEGHEKALAAFREFNRSIHAIGTEDKGPKEKVFVLVHALMDLAQFRPDGDGEASGG
jgi:transcriptional regulator with XRE-family HTH domain